MEKCPKCGEWSVSLDSRRGVLSCCRVECMFEQKVIVAEYLVKTNVLPLIGQAANLNSIGTNKIAAGPKII